MANTTSQTDIHTFDNGVKVYEHHLLEKQRERYQKHNLHEPEEEVHFTACIRAVTDLPFVFLDIGAAIGYYSILVKKMRPEAIIHAFEPLEQHRQYFLENLTLNEISQEKIYLYPEGISDRAGSATFVEHHYGSRIGESLSFIKRLKRFAKRQIRRAPASTSQTSTIAITTLDRIIPTIQNPVHLVKVDVQGAEVGVLRGAKQAMSAGLIKQWIIGTHSAQIHADCLQLLQQFGYQIKFENLETIEQPDGIIVAEYAS